MKPKIKIGLGIVVALALFNVLEPASAANDREFNVVSTTPVDGSKDVSVDTSVSITFSAPANESTLTAANFIVMNTHDGDFFDGDISYDNPTFTVILSNFSFRGGGQLEGGGGLHRGANIVVKLLNIEDIYGNKLVGSDGIAGSNFEFHFDVEPRETEADEDSPGFGLLAVIIGVVAVMALMRLAKSEHRK